MLLYVYTRTFRDWNYDWETEIITIATQPKKNFSNFENAPDRVEIWSDGGPCFSDVDAGTPKWKELHNE